MASLMADREGTFPTIHRAATIDCVTVKNRMETKRLTETLEALDKSQTRSLRRLNSSQEKLISSSKTQNAASIATNGKRRISSSSCSFSAVETEAGGESHNSIGGSMMMPGWHVHGRNVDEEGVEATLTKSFVSLGDERPDSISHAGHLLFPSVEEKEKVGHKTKEGNVDQQKSKQRNASRTFLLIPEIRNHSPKGISRQTLTPPMQSTRDRLRLFSDPSPTAYSKTTPIRSPCIVGKQHFCRSHSFSGLASTIPDRSASSLQSLTPSYKTYGNHQRLKVTRSLDRHSKGSPSRAPRSPALSQSFCPICRSTTDCSIFHGKEEFCKLSLADQMEVIKGSRYLRLPTAGPGRTSPK